MHILLVGMGDVGCKLACALDQAGHRVSGLCRTPKSGLPPTITLLLQSVHAADLSALAPIDGVYVILAPDQSTPAAYTQTFIDSLPPLVAALAGHPVQRVIFVSSTSVYGENAGEWVDESTPVNPTGFNGQLLWQAEQAWRQQWQARLTVVRPSGIYAANRQRLLRWIEQGRPVASQQWSNRIHVDDVVGFLAYLADLSVLAPLYLLSDSQPSPQHDVLAQLAEWTNQPAPAVTLAEPSGKRIDNRALHQSGYVLRYPNWRLGYAQILLHADG